MSEKVTNRNVHAKVQVIQELVKDRLHFLVRRGYDSPHELERIIKKLAHLEDWAHTFCEFNDEMVKAINDVKNNIDLEDYHPPNPPPDFKERNYEK